jgi:hypothetical protein
MHPDDIVRLSDASNPQEAHVLRQALEEEGIRAQVVGDYLDAWSGDMIGARPEVWVHRDDLPRAQEVLARHTRVASAAGEDEGADEGADEGEPPDEATA